MNDDEYLHVEVSDVNGYLLATTANGISLAKGSGCSAWFVGDTEQAPIATDYFRYLEGEGWQLVSSDTLQLNRIVYTFRGGHGYRIIWKENLWYGEAKAPSAYKIGRD